MPLEDDTRREIEALLNRRVRLPEPYTDFLVKWLVFNRAYNDLIEENCRDRKKVLKTAKHLQRHWGEVADLAADLVSMECVGANKVRDYWLLKPNEWVKSATLYLRHRLGHAPDPTECCFHECRPEKRALCNGVETKAWTDEEMAALLRIVYQVRCNLIHGDKRLWNKDFQTNRDRKLIELSSAVLDNVLYLLLKD